MRMGLKLLMGFSLGLLLCVSQVTFIISAEPSSNEEENETKKWMDVNIAKICVQKCY